MVIGLAVTNIKMNSLKAQILQYIKNKYPQEVSGVEIEDLARYNGYSAENGRRRLRELTGHQPNKPIEAISKTILKAGNKRINITNYRYKGSTLPPPFKQKPQPIDTKQQPLI